MFNFEELEERDPSPTSNFRFRLSDVEKPSATVRDDRLFDFDELECLTDENIGNANWINCINWLKETIDEMNNTKTLGNVNGAQTTQREKQGWRKVELTVDSGAAESVIPPWLVTNYPIVKPLHPIWYQSATGEPIADEGEQQIPVVTQAGRLRGLKMRAAEVTKPLASVKRMVDAKHAVVFAPQEMGGELYR